ncbi:hypothetical protein M5D96_003302, partial [Drosophila gunungcola]
MAITHALTHTYRRTPIAELPPNLLKICSQYSNARGPLPGFV